MNIILNEQTTKLDNDYYTLWAKFMLKPNAKKFQKELEDLAERGNFKSLMVWAGLYPKGTNEILDNIIARLPNKYEVMDMNIFMFDKSLEAETKEEKEMNSYFLSLAKLAHDECKTMPKAEVIKNDILISKVYKDLRTEEYNLEQLVTQDEIDIEELIKALSGVIFLSEKIKPKYVEILKQIADREYSFNQQLQI